MKFSNFILLLIIYLSGYSQPNRFNSSYIIPPGSNATSIYSIINLDSVYFCVGINQYTYPQGVISFTLDSLGILMNSVEYGDSNSLCLMSEESYVKNKEIVVGFVNKNYNYSPMQHEIIFYYFSNYDTTKSKIIDSKVANCSITKLIKKDNNYYFTGWIDTLSSTYYWLVKTDSLGNKLWEKYYGGGGGEISYQIISTKENNILFSGESFSFGNNSPLDNGQWYVVKTDTGGNVIWEHTYGNPNLRDYRPHGLIETSDSNYIITGSYAVAMSGSSELLRGRILKIDRNGNIIWDKLYGKIDQDTYTGIIKECPNSTDLLAIHNNGWYYPIVLSSYSPIIERLTSQGEIKWFRRYYYTLSDYGQSVLNSFDFTSDGGYIFAGYGMDYDSVPAQRSWVIKTDSLGFDGVTDFSSDTTYRIELSLDSCYNDTALIITHTYGITAPYTITYSGFAAHDSLYYSPLYEPYIADTLIITGSMLSGNDSIIAIPCTVTDGLGRVLHDTLTVNVGCLVSGVETQAYGNKLLIYPNPANDNLTVEITNTQLRITNVEIIDITGKKLMSSFQIRMPSKSTRHSELDSESHTFQFNKSNNVRISIGNLPAGVYFVKVETNQGIVVKKFVKQ